MTHNQNPVPVYIVRKTSPVTWGCAGLFVFAVLASLVSSCSEDKSGYRTASAQTPTPTPNPYHDVVQRMVDEGLIVALDPAAGEVIVDNMRWYRLGRDAKNLTIGAIALAWDTDHFGVYLDEGSPRYIARWSRANGIKIFDGESSQ